MCTRYPRYSTFGALDSASAVATAVVIPAAARAAPGLPQLKINAVIQNHSSIADAIEVVNLGDTTVDLSGWTLADDKNAMPVAAGTLIAPGQYRAFAVDDASRPDKFGLGQIDEANLKQPDGTLIQTFSCDGRCAPRARRAIR